MVSAHLESLFDVMRQAGVTIEVGTDEVRVTSTGQYRGIDIETQPYPGFPTDLQAQFMAMMCLADGHSKISETILENRSMHVPELVRMGAEIQVEGHIAPVRGTPAAARSCKSNRFTGLCLPCFGCTGNRRSVCYQRYLSS